MFDKTIEALHKYEEIMSKKPTTYDEEFEFACAEFDIAKALVWDLGFKYACKLAKCILSLYQLHPMR